MSIGQMQSIFARLDALERENDQLRKRLESLEEAVTVPTELADAAYVALPAGEWLPDSTEFVPLEKRGRGRPKGALNGR